jgi:hypothetical protein
MGCDMTLSQQQFEVDLSAVRQEIAAVQHDLAAIT